MEPELAVLDVNGLISLINSNLANPNEDLARSSFEQRIPLRNLFPLSKRIIHQAGKSYLIQNKAADRGLFSGMAGIDRERGVGYVFFEQGVIDEAAEEDPIYEGLRLRIKHPIQLTRSRLIPNCSVTVFATSQELDEGPDYRVRYHVPLLLGWRRTDLSHVLPPEWFFKAEVREYVKNHGLQG
ncbi:MAG: hypothetical protein KKD18_04105 [Nanoarchaeota archaeon]|nr:hypothetical protein [Nanoarchaeota archaeon]MBU0977574.1 hypothetical protein [Nanoarchaeota archaeon]